MNDELALGLLGAAGGGGVWLLIDGLRMRELRGPSTSRRVGAWTAATSTAAVQLVGIALLAGLAAALITRWVAAGVATAAAILAGRRLLDDLRSPVRAIARVDAIATWTEMLRDTMAGGGSLAGAIAATAPLAPAAIRPAVVELAGSLGALPRGGRDGRMGTLVGGERAAFVDFADDVADPLCDLVVNELIAAAQGEASHLNDRLSAVATSARQEAVLRRTVEAERAESRGAAKWVIGGVLALLGYFLVFDRDFLAPYDGAQGQAVLVVVIGLNAGGVLSLARVFRASSPPRHFPPRRPVGEGT